jgi:hypothetical protein
MLHSFVFKRCVIEAEEQFLEPLTSQIKDLLAVNKNKQRLQRYYTTAGFFVGLAGLATDH